MAKPPKPLPPHRQPKPEPVMPEPVKKKEKPKSVFGRTNTAAKNKKRKTQVFPR